jgi:predicted metalloprotease with PDZ domain
MSVGAWEHSYSSTYVLAEDSFDQDIQGMIPDIVAHEFFHIVTPLNIHSEIIETFNFVEPVASEHLWLYEGTTEWASDAMQLRAGLITVDEYVDRFSVKMSYDDLYDKEYSLSQLSLNSYTKEGQAQYGNIYQRGALVSSLLDLRLLELSGGTRGLREVLLELSSKYGPDRAFDEAGFFDEFVAITYPEIGDFFDKYVKRAEPLPIAEYFENIGISYTAEMETGEQLVVAGLHVIYNGEALAFVGVDDHASACGFENGDIMKAYNGQEVNLDNVKEVIGTFSMLEPEVDYDMTVVRDDGEIVVTCDKYVKDEVVSHVFTVDEVPSPDQVALREAWTRNLPEANP